MKEVKVSIIAIFCRIEGLNNLIQSVRVSTPHNAYEIIAVSVKPVENENIKWLSQQKDVILISNDIKNDKWQKKSLNYYRNLGINRANNEWVVVISEDMFFEHDWYVNFVNTLSKSENFNLGMIIAASNIEKFSSGCHAVKIGQTKKGDNSWKDLYLADPSIIRKEVFCKGGYYDEKLDRYGNGEDIALAVEFLTDKDTIVDEKIMIKHSIVEENQKIDNGDLFFDSHYIIHKWNKWCAKNNCLYSCNLRVDPYAFSNILKHFILSNSFLKKCKIIKILWKIILKIILNIQGKKPKYTIHKTAQLEKKKLVIIKKGAEIKDYVIIRTYESPVAIGSYTQLNPFTVIYGGSGVYIGNNVMVGPHCMFASGNHDFKQLEKPMRFAGSVSNGPIIVEDNVWIGANCTITDGVKICNDAVIGANSVVTKDVAAFDIVAGAPARVIGNRKNHK
jgi:acetyltransferase-like isoleucine patch superfamily enzyme